MAPRRWTWDPRARIEREIILNKFSVPYWEASSVMWGNMEATLDKGKHPEELPRRRALRALPAVAYPGEVMYLLFTAIKNKQVVLHAAFASGETTERPPLLPDAWRLAQK